MVLLDFRKVSGASDGVLRKICHGIVHQESAPDSGEDDEIAMGIRSQYQIIRGQGPLSKHGRAVRSPVFSLALLQRNRKNAGLNTVCFGPNSDSF